jgi:hypothetical protein
VLEITADRRTIIKGIFAMSALPVLLAGRRR